MTRRQPGVKSSFGVGRRRNGKLHVTGWDPWWRLDLMLRAYRRLWELRRDEP